MSLWLVGKKRSITLMAPQSANGTAMNMTTRIAISRLVILFIFRPHRTDTPLHLNSKYFAAKRRSAARAINENKTKAAIKTKHKKKAPDNAGA